MLNLIQVQERLKDMPMQAVMQYANGSNPMVPPFLALGELNRRKKMQENAAAEQAKEMAGAPSIKDQIEQATGLMALQGARQRQASQQQAGIQANMPMAAPNTMTSEPAQMASGGAVDDVMQRDYQGGGIAGGLNPQIIKKLMAMKAMKNRKAGLQGLPIPADMFKRSDYAGGGIVAFQKGGATAADVINTALEDSEDVAQDIRAEETGVPREELDLRDVLRRLRQVKTLEQMKQEAGVGERPDDRAERLKALEAERQRFGDADTVTRRILALDPRRLGPSMSSYLEKREAGQTSLEARIAEIQDLKAKAAYDAKIGDLSKSRAEQLEALDKERGILKDIGESAYKAALKAQALAGRTSFDDRAAQSYVRARKAQGDPRSEDVLLDEGYLRVLRERGASFKRAEKAGEVADVNTIDKARNNVDARLKDVKSKEFRELNAKMAQDRKNKQAGNPTDLAGEYKNSLYTQELNALQNRGSAPASTQTQAGSASDPLGIRR